MTADNQQIDKLVADLACAELEADAFNEYAPGDRNNGVRRANLRLYLQTLSARKATTLLVMEAPGYRGCRLTGVPVTSRSILLDGVPKLRILGAGAGYRDVDDSGFERIFGEQSATIVWATLASLNTLPLIWNAFPFHPHKAGQALSNRRPRKSEIALGAIFLGRIIDLWRFKTVIAVGNVAYEMMTAMGIECSKVRHPAHGGKNEFVAGMRRLSSVGA